MTWKELQQEAQQIVDNVPQGEFSDRSFTTGSGGSPANRVGVPEVHRKDTAGYNTLRHGMAYAGEVVVRCRKTGAMDINGREIYEAENGTVFVYRYFSGAPEYFDSGSLVSPGLKGN